MMNEHRDLALPEPRINADSREFWEGARNKRLLLKICRSCAHAHYPPRHLCPKCWSNHTDWIESSGSATVYSFTIMRRAPSPEFNNRVPYVVALLDLPEGPRMMANIVGDDALDVHIGDPVVLVFEDRQGINVPQFQRKS